MEENQLKAIVEIIGKIGNGIDFTEAKELIEIILTNSQLG